MKTEIIQQNTHELLIYIAQDDIDFNALIAIHNTSLGKAFGGCRMQPYACLEDAISDVMLLSEAMTYKSAFYNIPYGGGKAVIIGSPSDPRKKEWLRVFAQFLNSLNGLYETSDDIGTSVLDMEYLRRYTPYARGILKQDRAQIPATAYGVYKSVKATAENFLNYDQLDGLKVSVQGLGKVGWSLCEYLHKEGVNLIVSDLNRKLTRDAEHIFQAKTVNTNEIHRTESDIFCPCAVGNVLNKYNIDDVNSRAIVGGANNPINKEVDLKQLHERGVCFIPDFVSNAGGVIDIICEDGVYNERNVLLAVDEIYNKTKKIIEKSASLNVAPSFIANSIVQNKIKGETCVEYQVLSA